MDFPRGKIIAFEGLDCSFKETNHKEFCRRFKEFFSDATYSSLSVSNLSNSKKKESLQQTIPIVSESFPRYDMETSYFVRQWLQGKYNRGMLKKTPDVINTFYALDRFDFWHRIHNTFNIGGAKIEQFEFTENELRRYGACFIFDRYTGSNAIYNPINGEKIQVTDLMYDANVFGTTQQTMLIPPPDIVVWMRMRSFDVLLNSIANKQNKDENELDKDFLHENWLRSEAAIDDGVYKSAGIKVIPIDVLAKDNTFKSREKIAEEVWFNVMGTLSLF